LTDKSSTEGCRYHLAPVLIAATGLQRGEVSALAWDRVDLNAASQ
jgi:integrase